jgi:1-phosphofructokinase
MGSSCDPSTPSALVFAPSPLLTVTIERTAQDGDEIHLHAGGQGFWVARLLAVLEIRVTLCGAFGGESGQVLRTLIEREEVRVAAVESAGSNGAYVHDRRDNERVALAEMGPPTLSRHEIDELYGMALVEALDADVCVLCGRAGTLLPADTYRRLASDVTANGTPVVADLAGETLDATLTGGVTVLTVSHEELLDDGRTSSDDLWSLVHAARELVDAGAEHVIVSRAADPALALLDGQLFTVTSPAVESLDARGGGDSMTAGMAAALARGESLDSAVRLAAAAGSLNVTRRGLATGTRSEIERLKEHVEVRPLEEDG